MGLITTISQFFFLFLMCVEPTEIIHKLKGLYFFMSLTEHFHPARVRSWSYSVCYTHHNHCSTTLNCQHVEFPINTEPLQVDLCSVKSYSVIAQHRTCNIHDCMYIYINTFTSFSQKIEKMLINDKTFYFSPLIL